MISQLFLVAFRPRNTLTSLGFLGLFRHRSGSLIEFHSACLSPARKKHKHHDAIGRLRRSRSRENVRIRQILLQGGWRPGRAEQPLSRKRTAMRRLLTGLVLLLVAAAIIPVALILLNAAGFSAAPGLDGRPASRTKQDFPIPRQFRARDGGSLQYYAYPAGAGRTAILIRGSAGPATTMHALAKPLRATWG
jgi:hypothetical protein